MNKFLCILQEIWAFLLMAIFLFVVVGSAYMGNSFAPSTYIEYTLVGALIILLYSVWNMHKKDSIILNIYRIIVYVVALSVVSYVSFDIYKKVSTGTGLEPYETIDSLNLSLSVFIFGIIIPLFIFTIHNIFILKDKIWK